MNLRSQGRRRNRDLLLTMISAYAGGNDGGKEVDLEQTHWPPLRGYLGALFAFRL